MTIATRHVFKNCLTSLLIGVAALCWANTSQAAVTCTSLSATALNFSYIGGTNSSLPRNVMSGVITAVCTRTLPTDTTITVGANNGSNGSGSVGRALYSGGGFLISYNLFRVDSSCNIATTFGDVAGPPNGSRISANFTGAVGFPETLTFNFWGCISGQGGNNIETLGYPAGLYADSTVIRLRAVTGPIIISNSIAINIIAPSKCTVSGGPADISFSYTAFGAANFQSSAFTANCTNLMPYTMTLSPTNGVVGGLKYQLGLTAATPGSASSLGPTSLNNVGGTTGKLHYINGVMDAGQAGQSGLPVSQPHTLTISY
jgi:Spore Coat Protein U domain